MATNKATYRDFDLTMMAHPITGDIVIKEDVSAVRGLDEENYPYVYTLVHKVTKEFYIGYREANEVPSHLDLGRKYKTSSDVIKKMGFDNFDYAIIAESINPNRKIAGQDAYDFEQELISQEFSSDLCLNQYHRHKGAARFRWAGNVCPESVKLKISAANKGRIKTKEEIEKSRKANLGQKRSDDTRLKISIANKGKRKSESHIAKLTGLKRTDETKTRISESRIGFTHSDDGRLNISKGIRLAIAEGRFKPGMTSRVAKIKAWNKFKDTWINAIDIYDIWANNGKVGAMRFKKLDNFRLSEHANVKLGNMIGYFRSGWIPSEDILFMEWMDNHDN